MNERQHSMMHEEQEDSFATEFADSPNVNHRGKSALYVVAYFALLAVLMYPAERLHLGAQGIFFAMLAAGLLLALCVLLVKWLRRRLAAVQLSKKYFVQLMVGYPPSADAFTETTPPTTASRPQTSLVALGTQPVVRSGEIVDYDALEGRASEEDELPETIIETNPVYLSSTFQPDVNSLMGATVLLCGMRRSGKSNGIAVLAEELARYYCPLCLGDTEDEYGPLADQHYLPRGLWAGSAALVREMEQHGVRNYVALDQASAYAFGQAIVRDVLQAVLHLKSFESDDEAALVMAEIIEGMHAWEASRPNSRRIPCTFLLDEASKWIPQRQEESGLADKEVFSWLQQAIFGTMVRRGGKQGLGLILATQRIAELDKRALQSQWKFLFRQTEAVDIALYSRLGLTREGVVTLSQGECFIFSPTVVGFRALLRARYSPHLAHTPGLSELASHLRAVRPLELVARHYARPAANEEQREEDEAASGASSREGEHEQSSFNPRAGEEEHPDHDLLRDSLSPHATVPIEKAAELLGLSANYVKSLRGKALKTAPRNKNQITIASIKQYKARQARRAQPAKSGTSKPALTLVPNTEEEAIMIGQASRS